MIDKWEYKIERRVVTWGMGPTAIESIDKEEVEFLNKQGSSGWRLHEFSCFGDQRLYYFERKLDSGGN